MRLLLDTGTFLWLAADDPKLSPTARTNCQSPEDSVYPSALSAWEVSIQHPLGWLPLPLPPHVYIASRRQWPGLEPLAFDEDCAAHEARLPRITTTPLTAVWSRKRF